jgi:hypothetical protein
VLQQSAVSARVCDTLSVMHCLQIWKDFKELCEMRWDNEFATSVTRRPTFGHRMMSSFARSLGVNLHL